MKARYQYRFYPTDQQQQSLAQLFGCVRVVWNDALVMCKQAEKLPGFNKLSALLTQTKKTIERGTSHLCKYSVIVMNTVTPKIQGTRATDDE